MTAEKLRDLEKGTACMFGTNSTEWAYFGYSSKRDEYMFTRQNGSFVKAVAVRPEYIANIRAVEGTK